MIALRWATFAAILAVMLQAQQRMEEALAQQTVLDLVRRVGRKAPPEFGERILRWMNDRHDGKAEVGPL